MGHTLAPPGFYFSTFFSYIQSYSSFQSVNMRKVYRRSQIRYMRGNWIPRAGVGEWSEAPCMNSQLQRKPNCRAAQLPVSCGGQVMRKRVEGGDEGDITLSQLCSWLAQECVRCPHVFARRNTLTLMFTPRVLASINTGQGWEIDRGAENVIERCTDRCRDELVGDNGVDKIRVRLHNGHSLFSDQTHSVIDKSKDIHSTHLSYLQSTRPSSGWCFMYRHLRARRALLQFKDVPLRTRRALLL